MCGSPSELSEEFLTQEKRKKGRRKSSFSNLSVTSPTSQLIFQPFHRFTYVTAHSPTLPLLHLRHSSFSNPCFVSPTSQALHLIHLASRPWKEPLWRASIPGIYRIPKPVDNVTSITDEAFNTNIIECAIMTCDQLAFLHCAFYTHSYCFEHFIESPHLHLQLRYLHCVCGFYNDICSDIQSTFRST